MEQNERVERPFMMASLDRWIAVKSAMSVLGSLSHTNVEYL